MSAAPSRRLCLSSPDLASRSGTGVFVAVIDSGVNPDHPHVGPVAGGVTMELTGETSDDYVDRLGHGTAVFAAVQEKAPGAQLYAVRVFEDRLATSIRALVAGLDWAAEAGAALVNLSLGTTRAGHAEAMADAVQRLGQAGGLVVAAAESEGRRCWPGSLPGAISVTMDPGCPRECVELREGPEGRVLFSASPYARPIPGVPPERNLNGISFAVANVTGVLARLLEGSSGGVTQRELCGRAWAAGG